MTAVTSVIVKGCVSDVIIPFYHPSSNIYAHLFVNSGHFYMFTFLSFSFFLLQKMLCPMFLLNVMKIILRHNTFILACLYMGLYPL